MMFIEKVKIFIESQPARDRHEGKEGYYHKIFKGQVNRAHSKSMENPI